MQPKNMPYQKYILEESLGYAMGRATRSLGALVNRNFAQAGYDVTCEQWSVLFNLGKKNGQSQQDLAGLLCKDKTSVTRLIDNMEKHSLVVRIPDKADRRQKLIYLTKKGKDLLEKLVIVIHKTQVEAQKSIKIKDIETCKSVLDQIYANIK
jgi:DNA-binding MarR family transcriptional regulator